MNIPIHPNTLYLLSAPPGTGKSTMLEQAVRAGSIRREMVLSTDRIRKELFGSGPIRIEGELSTMPRAVDDAAVFRICEEMAAARLRQGLATIIDATSVNDRARSRWNRIAYESGARLHVLILDTPRDLSERWNQARDERVGKEILDRFWTRFEKESRYPFTVINTSRDSLAFSPWRLPHEKIDVVGDLDGLYHPHLGLLHELGYREDPERGFLHQTDPDRRILWLGDIVDRHPDSLRLLKQIRLAITRGGHLAIQGNHERKLWQTLDQYLKNGILPEHIPHSRALTLNEILKLPRREQQAIRDFLAGLPLYYIHETQDRRLAFVHGDIPAFDPMEAPAGEITSGATKIGEESADRTFDAWTRTSGSGWEIIRGHIRDTGADNVLSLDGQPAFLKGRIHAIPLDRILESEAPLSKHRQTTRIHVEGGYDFDAQKARRTTLAKDLAGLSKRKLVTRRHGKNGMALYKYSRRVFYDNLWNEHPALLKARGLVLDMTGDILQHPFDKVFNDGEHPSTTNVPGETRVIAVEKLNGFLGCVSADPYSRNGILYTTTGSFDSPFVDLLQDTLRKSPGFGRLMHWLQKNPDHTLMFEILSPDDPHIIPLTDDRTGAWLIGARRKDPAAMPEQEAFLDDLARDLGLRRPRVVTGMSLAETRELTNGSLLDGEPFEGFMIRRANDERFLMKVKTPWYLGHKFIARMSENKIRRMYRDPGNLFRNLDEELARIVTQITSRVEEKTFRTMDDQARLRLIHELTSSPRPKPGDPGGSRRQSIVPERI